jgi:hypothetical protein
MDFHWAHSITSQQTVLVFITSAAITFPTEGLHAGTAIFPGKLDYELNTREIENEENK